MYFQLTLIDSTLFMYSLNELEFINTVNRGSFNHVFMQSQSIQVLALPNKVIMKVFMGYQYVIKLLSPCYE